jgi:hypothetical protein
VATPVFEALTTSAAEMLPHGDLSTTLRTWKRLLQLILRFPYLNVTAQSKPYANASKTNYIPGGSKAENSLYFHHLIIPFLLYIEGSYFENQAPVVLMSIHFMVPKCLVETVLIHHVLLIVLCENKNVDTKPTDDTLYGKEEEMSRSKKFMSVVRGDKKLLGMFGGIVIDVTALVAILVMACVWYLP